MSPIPITIVTGFLGSGKTTLILNLIPQLPENYKVALLKNEFGDVAIDSQLASSASISGVQELLNGCICCNLVGQLGEALETLRKDISPNRIIIETSGSAFPATLALEVNRLAAETGHYSLDGVVVVIDVENWEGYEDTSYTAKMQARYTDLIVFNKWERVDERRYDICLDRVGDLDVQVATVKSAKGKVDREVLLGLDGAIAKDLSDLTDGHNPGQQEAEPGHEHEHVHDHQQEVEVLSVTLSSANELAPAINLESLETFLLAAPKQEIYRIKGIITTSGVPASSDGEVKRAVTEHGQKNATYILNWAFGRWVFTPLNTAKPFPGIENPVDPADQTPANTSSRPTASVRLTIVLARGEANSWMKRIKDQRYVETEDGDTSAQLSVRRIL